MKIDLTVEVTLNLQQQYQYYLLLLKVMKYHHYVNVIYMVQNENLIKRFEYVRKKKKD